MTLGCIWDVFGVCLGCVWDMFGRFLVWILLAVISDTEKIFTRAKPGICCFYSGGFFTFLVMSRSSELGL